MEATTVHSMLVGQNNMDLPWWPKMELKLLQFSPVTRAKELDTFLMWLFSGRVFTLKRGPVLVGSNFFQAHALSRTALCQAMR